MPFLPPWCLAGCPVSPFLPPWCLPRASQAVQMVLSCLPGAFPDCPTGPFLPPRCLPGASQAVPVVLSCFPGASQVPPWCLPGGPSSPGPFLLPWFPGGPFLPPRCLPGCPINPFLPPWCLTGCPNGPFLPPWCSQLAPPANMQAGKRPRPAAQGPPSGAVRKDQGVSQARKMPVKQVYLPQGSCSSDWQPPFNPWEQGLQPNWEPWCLPGCPNGPFPAGDLPGSAPLPRVYPPLSKFQWRPACFAPNPGVGPTAGFPYHKTAFKWPLGAPVAQNCLSKASRSTDPSSTAPKFVLARAGRPTRKP